MFHSNLIYLLVPALLGLLGSAGALMRESQQRRRFVAAMLLLEPIFCLLAADLRGSLVLVRNGAASLVLRGDAAGSLLSIFFSVLFCLAGFFGFEYLEGRRERSFYCGFMLMQAAAQLACCAGTGFCFALAFWAALACGWAMLFSQKRHLGKTARFGLITLAAAGLLLLGALGVLVRAGGALTFTPGGLAALAGTALSPLLLCAAVVLAVAFCFLPCALLCFAAAGRMPNTLGLAAFAGVLPALGVLAWLRFGCEVFRAAALRASLLFPALPYAALGLALACALAALRAKSLALRLAFAVSAEYNCLLAGVFSAGKAAVSAGFGALFACGTAAAGLFLAAAAFDCKTGKLQTAQLQGVGREMPFTLFCYAVCALSLAGLPPFGGFAARWGLAASLPLDAVAGPALLSLFAAGYLLTPVARGFFPGGDYEPDMKVRAGPALIFPLGILAGMTLLGGLFGGLLAALAREVGAALIL